MHRQLHIYTHTRDLWQRKPPFLGLGGFTAIQPYNITYLFSFTAQCPELPPLLNGAITYGPFDMTAPYDSGTLATHTCDLGFLRVGVEIRACLGTTMTWSDEAPVCERKIRFVIIIGSGKAHTSAEYH